MTFADVLQTYRERLNGYQSLKERSKAYREERITALLKSWPDLNQMDVAQISKAAGLVWAARFGKTASPSAFNNTIETFRLVSDIAVEAGARYDNPAVHIKRKKFRLKQLQLPSQSPVLGLRFWNFLLTDSVGLMDSVGFTACDCSPALSGRKSEKS